MKMRSEKEGLSKLKNVRETFRSKIENGFETKAKDCLTCEVKGACCTDAHFVNVHITRLDAVAISAVIIELSPELQDKISVRTQTVLEKSSRDYNSTYSCPLFEPGIGCVVHETAKPVACINHACYESKADLPPDSLLNDAETKLGKLNDQVYRSSWNWLPIPVWLDRLTRKSSA